VADTPHVTVAAANVEATPVAASNVLTVTVVVAAPRSVTLTSNASAASDVPSAVNENPFARLVPFVKVPKARSLFALTCASESV